VLRDLATVTTQMQPTGVPEDDRFVAEMNALTVKDAEKYYRTMMREDTKSWNIRDEHFALVVQKVAEHLQRQGRESKIVVWAHNSHIGDARATDMGKRRGEWNVGQLCREIFGEDNCFNVGFIGSKGTGKYPYR
jgi:erythromycin esterase-like protein